MRDLSFFPHFRLITPRYDSDVTDGSWERGTWAFAEGDLLLPGRSVVRLLGGGRRYEAYLVWDDALYSLAVAKVVRPGRTRHRPTLAGMAGEAEALSRLAHPHLVRCFDALLDGERPHLLLELLDGPRLSTLQRRYGIVVEQVLPLALQLCSALHYMHGQGWVHLDVKPRNIIMSSTPKLIDLSVALRIDNARHAATPVGTDAYMAPEQCDPARFREIGPTSDSWGLGVTLYEALGRRRPFPQGDPDAGTLADRYPQVVVEPEPLSDDVLPLLREVVHACLQGDPLARPAPIEIAETLEPVAALLPRPRLGRFRPGSRVSRPPAPAR